MASPLTHQQALELVLIDRLNRMNGFIEVPTPLFIDKVDVNMPALPLLAFYQLKNGRHELFKQADQAFSPLTLSNHDSIWIREQDFPYLKKFADSLIVRTPAPGMSAGPGVEKRVDLLRKSAITVVDDLFKNPSPENIARSSKVVSSFVYLLMKDPHAFMVLTQLSSHDPYTLQHSVGAAVNSIILAKKLGFKAEADLHEVGLAGLLHDIGKVAVDKNIINKPGPLDESEWVEMKKHPEEGYAIVKDNSQVSARVKHAILEHHEDKHGTGYPNKLKLDEIDIFSKIVGLSDILNALTTNRSYSKARSPFEAFQLIRDKMPHKVDDQIFKELVLIYGGKYEE